MKRMLQTKQQRQQLRPSHRPSVSVVLAALLVVGTTAFTTPTHNALHQYPVNAISTSTTKNPFLIPTTRTNFQDERILSRSSHQMTKLKFKDDKHRYDENLVSNMKQEWNVVTKDAGNLIRNVGSKVLYAAGWLVSNLLNVMYENLINIKNKISPTTTTTTTPTPTKGASRRVNEKNIIMDVDDDEDDLDANSYYTKLVEDTAHHDDEGLFRTIMGLNKKKSKNSDGIDASHSMIDHVIHKAVSLLEQDEMSTYLLGTIGTTSSLKYSEPISQRSDITTSSTDNKATRTIHARFEVTGNYGRKGIATVMSNDLNIVSLDLEVDGRLHRVTTKTTPKSSFRSSSSSPNIQVENKKDTHNYVDVEVMKGVYWPTVASLQDENIIDAEIEDKKFF